jgi:hypothetical protein
MTPFEYVIVLVSIILGLGITTILTGVAELIKHGKPLRVYTPYIIWILLIFVLHIQEWWISYQLMSVKVWTLHFFLLVILYPINLYILAHLLFPGSITKDFDTRNFYLEHHPRIFIGAITLVIISIVQNVVITQLALRTQVPHFIVLITLVGFTLGKNRSSTAHTVVSLLLLMMMIIGFAFDQENLTLSAPAP